MGYDARKCGPINLSRKDGADQLQGHHQCAGAEAERTRQYKKHVFPSRRGATFSRELDSIRRVILSKRLEDQKTSAVLILESKESTETTESTETAESTESTEQS